MGALVLVSASDFLDVVLHDGNQRLVVKAALTDPGGELRVPDQSVAAHFFVVAVGKVCYGVCAGKGKVVALGLGGLPFHGIFGGDGVEVGAGLDDALFDGVVADGQGCADVLATLGSPGLGESLVSGGG